MGKDSLKIGIGQISPEASFTPTETILAWRNIRKEAETHLKRLERHIYADPDDIVTFSRYKAKQLIQSISALLVGADLLEHLVVQDGIQQQSAANDDAYKELLNIAMLWREAAITEAKNRQDIADAWQAASETDNELFTILTATK